MTEDRLSRYHQTKISVIGRKSGQTISAPVWFVYEDDKLYLLPVRGSDTQWYKNVLRNPWIRIEARGRRYGIASRFRHWCQIRKISSGKIPGKYGAKDVKKYYSMLAR